MSQAYRTESNGTGHSYVYLYNDGYTYDYTDSEKRTQTFQRSTAATFQQAPIGEMTQTYDAGSGGHGAIGITGGIGGMGSVVGKVSSPESPEIIEHIAEAVTPFTRFETEGPMEACYDLLADILHKARPFPNLIPGVAYWPKEGHSADIILWLHNLFGQRIPVNVGFADGMVEFSHSILGADGMKRPDEVFFPGYGIVTYQGDASVIEKFGIRFNTQKIKVHKSADELRQQLGEMGLLPQDVAASVLYGLVAYGRKVPQEFLERAAALGVVSINAADYGTVILPTKERIFRIQTGNPVLDAADAALVQTIFSHLENADDVFSGATQRDRKKRAIPVTIGVDGENRLVVTHEDRFYQVTKTDKQFKLQPLS